jgi:uncharacterized membrane protein YccC
VSLKHRRRAADTYEVRFWLAVSVALLVVAGCALGFVLGRPLSALGALLFLGFVIAMKPYADRLRRLG